MAPKTAESILKALRKLDANKSCPNCGHFNDFGYGNVCVKFKTFVCDLCKTSHQAVSHRVKSLTMSTWTLDEVNELADENGGGNDAARHIWLQRAPAFGGRYGGGKRPKDGDKIEVYKQFVIDCYDQGMFRASDAYEPGQDNSASSAPVHVPSASKQSAASATVSHSKPSVATTVDLLNDDHFSSPPPVKSTSIANDFAAFTVPSAPVSSAVHNSFLHDDGSNFSAFQMAPPVSQPDSNVWGDFVQSPSAAPTSQFGAVHTLVPTPAAAHLYSGQPASQPTSYNTSTPIQPTSFPPAQVQGAPVPQSRPTQVAISNVLSMFDAPVASPSSVKTASGNGLNSSHTGLSPMGGMNSASAISGLGAPYGSMPMPMGPQGAYAPMGYGAPQHQVPHPHALNMPLSTPMPMGMNMAPSMGQGGWPGSPVSQPHNNMMMGGYGGHPVPQTNYNQPTMSMSSNGMMKSAVMSIPNTSQMNQGGASSSTDNSFGFVQGMIRK